MLLLLTSTLVLGICPEKFLSQQIKAYSSKKNTRKFFSGPVNSDFLKKRIIWETQLESSNIA